MKSRIWLPLFITTCLIIAYFTINVVSEAPSEEEDSPSKRNEFVLQDDKSNSNENIVIKENETDPDSTSLPNFGFTNEEAEKLKQTEEKFQFQVIKSRGHLFYIHLYIIYIFLCVIYICYFLYTIYILK